VVVDEGQVQQVEQTCGTAPREFGGSQVERAWYECALEGLLYDLDEPWGVEAPKASALLAMNSSSEQRSGMLYLCDMALVTLTLSIKISFSFYSVHNILLDFKRILQRIAAVQHSAGGIARAQSFPV
jgi:hypothetical protein